MEDDAQAVLALIKGSPLSQMEYKGAILLTSGGPGTTKFSTYDIRQFLMMNDAAGQVKLQCWGSGDSLLERCLARPVLQSFLYAPSSIKHFERPIILLASTIMLNKWYSVVSRVSSRASRSRRQQQNLRIAGTTDDPSPVMWRCDSYCRVCPRLFLDDKHVQSPQTQLSLFLSSETPLIPLLLSLPSSTNPLSRSYNTHLWPLRPHAQMQVLAGYFQNGTLLSDGRVVRNMLVFLPNLTEKHLTKNNCAKKYGNLISKGEVEDHSPEINITALPPKLTILVAGDQAALFFPEDTNREF
ncbi:hypothetical protein IW261DRAFT_1426462 [Armillaria novae-zelandiae]|uniref:Uncharacterized protein n=1 Tax=Armillaria novae-zelandiae TaxID=153914 RepID=A0AA39T6E7_9AGAR|nr:hypothetical protein IW261DRAFT_1426462 [Armillaria novae-zelandiae]